MERVPECRVTVLVNLCAPLSPSPPPHPLAGAGGCLWPRRPDSKDEKGHPRGHRHLRARRGRAGDPSEPSRQLPSAGRGGGVDAASGRARASDACVAARLQRVPHARRGLGGAGSAAVGRVCGEEVRGSGGVPHLLFHRARHQWVAASAGLQDVQAQAARGVSVSVVQVVA